MKKHEKMKYALALAASVPIGFLSAGFLHGFLTGQVNKLNLPYLFGLLFSNRTFRLLFLLLFILVFLAMIVLMLEDKPYKSELKTIAHGIEIPLAAGQLQHGSARFMTEAEVEKNFATVVLRKKDIKKLLMDQSQSAKEDHLSEDD